MDLLYSVQYSRREHKQPSHQAPGSTRIRKIALCRQASAEGNIQYCNCIWSTHTPYSVDLGQTKPVRNLTSGDRREYGRAGRKILYRRIVGFLASPLDQVLREKKERQKLGRKTKRKQRPQTRDQGNGESVILQRPPGQLGDRSPPPK